MVSTDALLAALCDKGVELRIHHGEIRYEDPDGSLTLDEVESLKRLDFELILRASNPVELTPPRIPFELGANSKLFPLAGQQVFALRYFRNSFYFLIPLHLRGAVNFIHLSTALAAVVQRHEALRIELVILNGIAMQKVSNASNGLVRFSDLTGFQKERADCEVRAVVEGFVASWASVGRDPINFNVVKLDEEDHLLLVVLDHAFWDYYSIEVFFRELWVLYDALCGSQCPTLSAPPLQYGEYASQQRKSGSGWFKMHRTYWAKRLAGANRIRLPVDGALDSVERYSVAFSSMTFGEPLSSALRNFARKQGMTIPMVAVMLYAALVTRWAKQTDFVIPFIASGRDYLEYMQAIGYFPHPLPLRIELTGTETFIELLTAVTREFLVGNDHLDIGTVIDDFSDLLVSGYVQWFPQPPLDLARPTPPLRVGGSFAPCVEPYSLTWAPLDWSQRFDVALTFCDSAQGISASVSYRADQFSKETMEWALRSMKLIAECAVQDPHSCVCLIELPRLEKGHQQERIATETVSAGRGTT